ncbi:MAG: sirohydrochlorin cobaltochelatase [Oscillospiraceae bacterium]|nr:sirohydrochlorin cobaltochelatase [Oscillospiraceae bacterium]
MGKAILVVSFGTSYEDTLKKTIAAIEDDIRAAYPDYEVRRAFTSGKIIKKIRERDGVEIDTVQSALEKLVRDGFKEVICAVTHIINGFEYDKITAAASEFSDKLNIKITRPLISITEDYEDIIEAVSENFKPDKLYVLMGHGTEHFANAAYPALDYHFKSRGFDNVFVATVEGFPSMQNVMDEIKADSRKRLVLMPLMLVAGDHANNDMADDWRRAFSEVGFEVECVMRGFGEYEKVRGLYIKRIEEKIQ